MKEHVVPTESYKGVRDFYPQDQFIQRYLFETMQRVCEHYGYEEYNASILESAELYQAKTSEEIVSEQTYTFTDRGGRDIILRPEMTPSLARMIAAKRRDIGFPARWYAIANVFRYERPQRGRLREHWQLNADVLGVDGIEADAEIIALAHDIFLALGAQERDFEIRVSDRRLLDGAYETVGIASEKRQEVTRLLDKRAKLDDFEVKLAAIIGQKDADALLSELARTTSSAYLEELRSLLQLYGVRNMVVDTSITRGFDYYTGMIFEVFDTDPTNRKALLGGGRYDNLLSIFGEERVSAVGFGMGDATARDFLETHSLLPDYASASELMLCVLDKEAQAHAVALAQSLRREDVSVAVHFAGKRAGDMIRAADKLRIPFVIMIGAQERDSGRYTIRQLETGNEITLSADRIAEHLFGALG